MRVAAQGSRAAPWWGRCEGTDRRWGLGHLAPPPSSGARSSGYRRASHPPESFRAPSTPSLVRMSEAQQASEFPNRDPGDLLILAPLQAAAACRCFSTSASQRPKRRRLPPQQISKLDRQARARDYLRDGRGAALRACELAASRGPRPDILADTRRLVTQTTPYHQRPAFCPLARSLARSQRGSGHA